MYSFHIQTGAKSENIAPYSLYNATPAKMCMRRTSFIKQQFLIKVKSEATKSVNLNLLLSQKIYQYFLSLTPTGLFL